MLVPDILFHYFESFNNNQLDKQLTDFYINHHYQKTKKFS